MFKHVDNIPLHGDAYIKAVRDNVIPDLMPHMHHFLKGVSYANVMTIADPTAGYSPADSLGLQVKPLTTPYILATSGRFKFMDKSQPTDIRVGDILERFGVSQGASEWHWLVLVTPTDTHYGAEVEPEIVVANFAATVNGGRAFGRSALPA